MRGAMLSLAVLAAIGLAASTALAGPPSASMAVHLAGTMVGHQGYYGYPHGHGGYSPRHQPYYYDHGRGSRFIYPMVPGHPRVIYPFPGHPPVMYPPIYRPYPYYYGPQGGFQYYGRGIGFSIGF